jgi:TPR repeat protein
MQAVAGRVSVVAASRPSDARQLTEAADRLTSRPGDRSRLAEAARLYRAAFRLGYSTAAYNLASSYQNVGEHRTAVRWFRRAFDAGDQSALLPLAQAELYGVGTSRDVEAALEKLKRVARGGRWFTQFDREQSMLLIALCLREGWLVRRDHPAAVRWLRRASRLGSAEAAGLLADLGEGA